MILTFYPKNYTQVFKILSSFDEYCTEVRSLRLQWSPVHKSEKFWRENAQRFNEKNFELIKILIRILSETSDALVLCVAAHDIGEYVRHYPRGKNIIEQFNGKQAVMKLFERRRSERALSRTFSNSKNLWSIIGNIWANKLMLM